ncbi:unnamed protein product [Sphacelaria rigidula]
MLHVPDLPEADAVRILRYFLSQAATQTRKTRSVSNHGVLPAGMAGTQGGGAGGGSPSNITVSGKGKLARRRRFRLLQKSRKATEPPLPKGKNEPSQQSEDVVECGVNGGAVGDNVSNAKNNVVVVGLPNGSLSNGHHASDDDGGGSSDTGNISEEGAAAGVVSDVGRAKGEAAPARPDGAVKTKKSRGLSNVTAAVRAERGLRVALTLPHNEAFLRSALSALSHGEVIVVLQILTRLLSEERTRETEQIVELKHSHAVLPGDSHSYISMNGVPPARTEAVVAWASAILDSHFTRLAIAGSHQDVLGVLQALKCAAVNEAECCDLLFQVSV